MPVVVPTGLTAGGGVGSITLNATVPALTNCLPYLVTDVVEIHSATTQNRALSSKIGETVGRQFIHSGLGNVETHYYWARVRNLAGEVGDFYPASATGGVSGTTLAVTPGPESITSSMLQPLSVTEGKIANAAISAAKIMNSAITELKIAAGAVTTAKLAVAAVTAEVLASGAVIAEKLANGAVTAAAIQAGVLAATHFATTIRPVEIGDALPETGNTEGRQFFLTTDGKLYRYHSGAWTAAINAVDIAGTLNAVQIASVAAASITGQLTNSQIEAVAAAKITGQIVASQIADAAVTIQKFATGYEPVGIVTGGSLPTVKTTDVITWNGKLYRWNGTAYVASVNSTEIEGTLTAVQIASVAAATVTGQLTNTQIAEIAAAKISGQIVASQIANAAITLAKFGTGLEPVSISTGTLPTVKTTETINHNGKLYRWVGGVYVNTVEAADITGTLQAVQIATVAAASVTGQMTNAQLAAIDAAKITGQIVASQLANGAVTLQKFATGYEPVNITTGTLPTVKTTETINHNGKLYRWVGGVYVAAVPAADISGQLVEAQIASVAAAAVTGQMSNSQLAEIAAAKISGTIVASQIANAAITFAKFASGLEPVGVVTGSLPTVKSTEVITYNSKLYRWNGTAYVATVPAADIAGTLTSVQIESVAATAVTGQLSDTQIAGVAAAKISGTIVEGQIANSAVTNAKLAALAVDASKIANNAITETKISDNAISTPKLMAGAIATDKLAANSVTIAKLAIGEFTNLVPNAVFDASLAGWTVYGGTGYSVTAYSGSEGDGVRITKGASTAEAGARMVNWANVSSDGHPIKVRAGEQLRVNCKVTRKVGTSGGNVGLYARVYDPIANTSTGVQINGIATTTALNVTVPVSGTYTVPAGVTGMTFQIYYGLHASSANGDVVVTDISVQRMNSGELIIDGSIFANHVTAGAITTAALAVGAVTADTIAADAVTAAKIQAGAIETAKLAAGAVTAAKIAALTITADKIAANAIVAGKIDTDAIVAANIQAGAITAAKLQAGSVLADKLGVGRASNWLPNSDMSAPIDVNWGYRGSSNAANFTVIKRLDTYAPPTGAYEIQQINATASQYYDVEAKNAAGARAAFTVVAGKYLELSAYVFCHRANARLYIQYFNAAGASIGYSPASAPSTVTAGDPLSDLANYERITLKHQIPAGAVTATPLIRHSGTLSGVNSYVWFTNVFFGQATANQTEFSDWSPGGITLIQGGHLITNSITTAHIQTNAVTATQIAALTITAAEIATDAITSAKIQAGAIIAAKIATGAILTEKLAALSITADKIAANAIVAGKIDTDAIVSANIQAGAISTDKLQANSVTAKILAIGEFTNLVPNATFSGTLAGWFTYGGAGYSVTAYSGAEGDGLRISKGAGTGEAGVRLIDWGTATADAHPVKVRPGEELLVSCKVTRKAGTSGGNIGLYGRTFNPVTGVTVGTQIGGIVTSTPVDVTQSVTGAYTVPAGVTCMSFQIYYGSHASSADSSVVVTDIVVMRKNTGQLIVNGAILAAHITAGAVETEKLAAGAVVAEKIAADAIIAAKIQAGAVETAKLAAGAVTAAKIAALTITADKIAANAIVAGKIDTDAIVAANIQAGAVTTSKLQAGSVLADKLGVGTGANWLPNSDMQAGITTNWGFLGSSNEANFSTQLRTDTYAPPGGAFQIRQLNATASQNYSVIAKSATGSNAYFDVVPGKYVEASVYVYSHRCLGMISVDFYTSADVYISSGTATQSAAQGGDPLKRLSNYSRLWTGPVLVPATAVKAVVYVRHNGTISGSTDSYLWWTRAYFGEARANQSEPSDWSPGGVTLVQGGHIVTNSIATAHIQAAAVTATEIATGAIIADKIAADAITAAKIQAGAVETAKLAAGAVTAAKIAALTITAGLIASNAITSDKIEANSIITGKIAAGAVNATAIASGAITTDKLGANAVTAAKIAAGTITTNELATNAVYANNINANAVTTAKIASLAVTTAELAAGAVTAVKIAAATITGDKIAGNTIAGNNIVAGTLTTKELIITNWINSVPDDGFQGGTSTWTLGTGWTIENTDSNAFWKANKRLQFNQAGSGYGAEARSAVFSLPSTEDVYFSWGQHRHGSTGWMLTRIYWFTGSGAALAGGSEYTDVYGGTVGTTEVKTGTVVRPAGAMKAQLMFAVARSNTNGAISVTGPMIMTKNSGNLIVDGSITTSHLAAGSITATQIAAATITADKFNITSLSAITANLGTVTAGTISGVTITGALIRSTSATTRVEMNQSSNKFSVFVSGTEVGYFGVPVSGGVSLVINSGGATVGGGLSGSSNINGLTAVTGFAEPGNGGTHGVRGIRGVGISSGLVGSATGHAFYAEIGGYGPFTGQHDGLLHIEDDADIGDILYDKVLIARGGVDNTLTIVSASTEASQRGVIGVLSTREILDFDATFPPDIAAVLDLSLYVGGYYRAVFNSVGEGQMNVCGLGGNLSKGDLIVASTKRGKGMRQSDDVVRSYTVARAREDVVFSGPNDVRYVSVIYLCG